MAADATLTLHVVDNKGSFRFSQEMAKIDLSAHRPIDVIQRLYQSDRNVANPGGSTIWKMSKCVSPPDPDPVIGDTLYDCEFLDSANNSVEDNDEVVIFELALA